MDTAKTKIDSANTPSRTGPVATTWLVMFSLVVTAFPSEALSEDRWSQHATLAEAGIEVHENSLSSTDSPSGAETVNLVSPAAEPEDEYFSAETGERNQAQDVQLESNANKKPGTGVELGNVGTTGVIFRGRPGDFNLPPALPPWAQKRSTPSKGVKGGYLALGIAGLGMVGAGVYMVADAKRSRNPATIPGIIEDLDRRQSQALWGGVVMSVGFTLAGIGFSRMR